MNFKPRKDVQTDRLSASWGFVLVRNLCTIWSSYRHFGVPGGSETPVNICISAWCRIREYAL